MTPNPNDFPEAIFTNTSAFGLMEHADELRRWFQEGGDVQLYGIAGWYPAAAPCSNGATVYRAVRPALIKPSVDWSHLLPWVQWVAWDERATVPEGYEVAPQACECGCGQWLHEDGRRVELTATPGLIRGTVPWTEAIVQRPEGV